MGDRSEAAKPPLSRRCSTLRMSSENLLPRPGRRIPRRGFPPMSRRSISAPTIAGFWWRGRRAAGFASSTRFRASSGLARGWRRPARCPRRRSRAPWMRSRSAPTRSPFGASSNGRYVATEACRRAANCEAFLARVREEVGLEIEIISTAEEARLVVSGCAPLLDPRIPYAIVFDIGGGSTEIVWLRLDRGRDRRRRRPQILGSISLPLGVVTLTDRFGGEVSPSDLSHDGRRGGRRLAAVRERPSHPAAHPRLAGCRCSAARAR